MAAKHILVCIDFSERSTAALPEIGEYARANGSKVTLLHVSDPHAFIPPQAVLEPPSTTDQTHQISSQIQMGRDLGMQTMDSALLEAINNKEIDPDDAIRHANDKKKFTRYVTDTNLVPILDIGDESMIRVFK